MNTHATQIYGVKPEELTQTILEGVENKLNQFEKKIMSNKQTIWITRKEAAEILSVSLVTISAWSQKKILKPYRIANKIRFKKSEVESALIKSNR